MKTRLLQLFNIRQSEAWLVSNLFWMQFFQGAGVAIFNTVAFALFLEHFAINELPKVYIFSALLLWAAGFIYSKFEHALSVKSLALAVIVFVTSSILFFRVELSLTNAPVFLFVMFSWYYVIYLLTNLEFWGIAALLFDIRQSKRLFGMIGAGDIPAKLIGYSAVPVLVHFIPTQDVLYISFGAMLISMWFYFRLRKAGKLELHVLHEHHQTHATAGLRDIVKSFFGNRMIATVALLSFIVLTCVTIISFSFYAEIKLESKTDKQLASFIAMFYAGGRILAIFIRLLLTGRITNILGTKGSLLISPAILFVFLIGIILLPFISHKHSIVIYTFGLMAIITEVLKTSLQDPVFLSLMQPLSSHLRLKGHTIVKGVMDPFALAFSGFMLYGILKISGKVDLFLLSYMLFTLLIIWVVMIIIVDKEYVKTLVTALNKRYSVGQEINLNNEKTVEVLRQKVSTGGEGEAMYALHLMEKQVTNEDNKIVLSALAHPSHNVRMQALLLAEKNKLDSLLPQIDQIISSRADLEILPEAVKAKCMLQSDSLDDFDEYLAEKDDRLMKAAITGYMTSGGISAVVTAGQKLLQLLSSDTASDRIMAADIIGDLGVQSFYKPLLKLFDDSDEGVTKAAILAAGKVKNEKLITRLMHLFAEQKHAKIVIEALQESGDTALPEIRIILHQNLLSRKQISRLILLCGRIHSDMSLKLLDELVHLLPAHRADIFHALHQLQFRCNEHNKEEYIKLIHLYINKGVEVVYMIQQAKSVPTAQILANALELELNSLRDALLLLFGFVYDKDKMVKARSAFQMKRAESIANAMEIIEIAVPKDISLQFIRLFESDDISEKVRVLSGYRKEGMTFIQMMDAILSNKDYHFHRWTKATALHALIFYKGQEKLKWMNLLAKEEDEILQESITRIRHEQKIE